MSERVAESIADMEHLIDKSQSCWLWLGVRNGSGYGAFRGVLAHRLAYELVVGPIPDGLHIDHLCRVRTCVNPDHMEPVTTRENTLRGMGPTSVNAHKTHCVRGHEFTPENTYVKRPHQRLCRACQRIHQRAYMARKRAGTAAGVVA